ncbi:hypothetical protein Tco_1441960 [Tanacetum coccineum]
MDVHVHHEIPSQQILTFLTMHVSVIIDSSPVNSTVIPQSLPSFTPPPQQLTSTPPPTTKATNPPSTLPDFASVFQFNNRVSALEKDVFELKKDDPLKTQVTALVDEYLDARLRATRDEFMSYLSASITARITKQLKKILIDKIDKSESYLAALEHRECYEGLIKSYDLDKTLFSTYDKVYSLKRSQKDKDKDEDPSVGSDRGLKKRKTNKDAEPTKGSKAKESQSGSSKGTKSQPKSSGKSVQSEKPKFKITNLTQETLLGPAFRLLKGTRSNFAELEYDFEECYKALSEKLDWENPEGGDYPFDLTKPLPLVMSENRQKVPVDYFFNNDLKYLQGGVLTMTYTTSITKTKAAQYDLPSIEDMVPNIWVLVKVAYDKHAVVTQVELMRKHGYGYLKEIVVRRVDNDLYRFKEGDFPCLRINDIENMLLLVVQNWLTNLLGNNVSDFAIALRMFTRSLVIQKLIRSDELYKFSDKTLTRLRTSLDDITKNIRMEYLPKRRWSTLKKKRANIMIVGSLDHSMD